MGARVPEPSEYRAALAALDRAARGRVVKAMNLGRPLDDPHEAALAVAGARSQQRFWRRWWAAGPVLAAVLRYPDGWEAMLSSAILAGAMFAGLGWYFARRAAHAAAVNQVVVDEAAEKEKLRKRPPAKPRKDRRPRKKRRR